MAHTFPCESPLITDPGRPLSYKSHMRAVGHARSIQKQTSSSSAVFISSSLQSKKRSHRTTPLPSMACHTTLTILFGFAAMFQCLEPLEVTVTPKIQTSQSGFARLAAGALLPAVLTTFGLTLLLLFAHVRALGRANAAGAGAGAAGRRFLDRLAKATLVATMAALLAGAVLRLVADDEVGWLNTQ